MKRLGSSLGKIISLFLGKFFAKRTAGDAVAKMVVVYSTLDSGSNDPGSSAGRGHCVVSLGKTLTLHAQCLSPPMSRQQCRGCDGLASHPGE